MVCPVTGIKRRRMHRSGLCRYIWNNRLTHGVLFCHPNRRNILRSSNHMINAVIQRTDGISSIISGYVANGYFCIFCIGQWQDVCPLCGLARSLMRPVIRSETCWLNVDDSDAAERASVLCDVCLDIKTVSIQAHRLLSIPSVRGLGGRK